MSWLNRNRKAVIPLSPPAPLIDYKAHYEGAVTQLTELQNKYTAAVFLAKEQATQDAATIKNLQADLDVLTTRHEAAIYAAAEQARSDAGIKANLKQQLEEARRLLAIQSGELERGTELIARLNQKGEELIARYEAQEKALQTARETIEHLERDAAQLIAENAGRNGAYDRLVTLSRQTMYLLNHPNGLHQPWPKKRDALVTLLKKMGLEETVPEQ